jgi:hypothetical protein
MSVELDKKRAKGRSNRGSIDGTYHGKMPVFGAGTTPKEDKEYWSAWGEAANWFNYKCKPKDYTKYIQAYAKDALKLSKEDIRSIKKLPDNAFLPISKLVAVSFTGFEYREAELDKIKVAFVDFVEQGKLIADDEATESANQPEKKTVSPQYRMFLKMMETVYSEFDEAIIEGWQDNDFKVKFDAFKSLKNNDVKGAAVKMFADRVENLRAEMQDAYDKKDDDIVEAYSHIKRSNLKKAVAQLSEILADVESAQLANKAVRKPRASKAKASDKQVAKLKYMASDADSKLASINPIQIPGAMRLYVYNVKQRKIFEYVSDNDKGFEVSGSTLKNVDEKLSRTTKLRKPQEFLPDVLKKTPRQIDNMFNELTTKVEVPNNRINRDCIILRVMDK